MTRHYYTDLIKSKLNEHGRLYFNELHRQTGIPRNILTSRLKELKSNNEIDNEAASRNGKVVSEYFLTEYAKIKQLWQIDSRQKQDNKDKVKAFLLITYFAAFGYEEIDNKKPSEVELGDVSIVSPNNGMIEHHSLHMGKKPGVSIDDLTNKIPGINRAAIFTYMDYSEEELKRYFNSLIKQKPPVLTALQKRDNWATTDTLL
jgi:DNA-binding HxlR family transcriptional regulator